MENELSNQMSNTEMIIHNFTETELETLKKTIAKGTTNEQFALFVATCKRSKLDPFLNQIHCIVYVGQSGPVMSIQFPVEGYVADAKRNPEYRGYRAAVVKEHEHFEADLSEATYVHKMEGLGNPGKTVGAYCKVFREGRPDVLVIVTVDQLAKHISKSKNKDTIDTWYDDFVVKHAVKRAFRIQFGIDFADEDGGGNTTDTPQVDPYVRKDVTPETVVTQAPKSAPKDSPKSTPKETAALIDITPNQEPQGEQEDPRKALSKVLKVKLDALSIPSNKDGAVARDAYYQTIGFSFFDPTNPEAKEIEDLIKLLDMKIAEKVIEDDKPL